MKKVNKAFLITGLVLFIIVEIIKIMNHIDIKDPDFITKLRYFSIPITTILLLVYVSDKGNTSLCKFGILMFALFLICELMICLEVVKYDYKGDNTFYNYIKTGYDLASGGLDFCLVLGLFSLCKSYNYLIIKKVAIILYPVYVIVVSLDNVLNYSKMEMEWILKVGRIIGSIAQVAVFTYIGLCLLNYLKSSNEKKDEDEDMKILEQVRLNQQTIQNTIPQQQVQPINQPIVGEHNQNQMSYNNNQ